MNKNGNRVGGFTIIDSHHTAFVALQSGSFAAEDNHVTIENSPQKAGFTKKNTSCGAIGMELKQTK